MDETKENTQLLTAKALAKQLSISTRTLWRYRSAGLLPRPVRIGDVGAIRWLRRDIDKWVGMGCPPQKDFEALAD
jgi:predicted DNA-binding transcriptional regulator AlpA